jgi:hypothetical protein
MRSSLVKYVMIILISIHLDREREDLTEKSRWLEKVVGEDAYAYVFWDRGLTR